jgi:hypothetical protein
VRSGKRVAGRAQGHTGGGTGIGRAAAVALASEGYEVTVAGRTAATLQETVKLVTETGGTAGYVIADVHDEDAVRHAVEVAAGEPAQLDVAVNSAGVDGGNDSHPFVGYPVQTLDLMLATNVCGMFFSMKYELEVMAKQGFGSIVNISSGAGLTGVPGYAGYVASKHAEIGLTKSAALDYLPSARPHRRARGGRRRDRLAGQQQVQLRHQASPCRSTAATSPADPPRHRSPRTQGAPTHDNADERTSIHGHHRR